VRTEDDLRAALRALERHAPDLSAVLPDAAPGTGRRRRLPRWPWLRIGGPVLVALAVVAAVVTPLTVGNLLKHDLPNEPGGSATSDSARSFLEDAAARLTAAPAPAAGAYWRVSVFVGNLGASGPNAHPFIIDERDMLSTTWYPSSPSAKTVAYANREQTSALPTPGAAAAWWAAGRPSLPHRAAKEVPYPDFGSGGDLGDPYFGGQKLTTAQYRALPTSTAELKSAIEAAAREVPAPLPGQHPLTQEQKIFNVCLALLDHDPVSPAVRAAALRVLATLPDIQLEGTVTDSLGRKGAAISVPGITAIPWGTGWGQSVPASMDPKAYPRLRIVLSPSGVLLDEEYATTAPSLSGLSVFPPSGAIPGPTKCPAGWYPYDHGNSCAKDGDVVHDLGGGSFEITGPHGGPASGKVPVFLNQPKVAVPTGTVLAYRAFIGAEWTNDTPSASASVQHIPVTSVAPGTSSAGSSTAGSAGTRSSHVVILVGPPSD
jgi:hypothetical protein